MTPPIRHLFPRTLVRLLVVLLAVALLAVVLMIMRHPAMQLNHQPVAQAQPSVTNMMSSPAVKAALRTNTPPFQLRPFAVVRESTNHQWTGEDGRDTNVIQRLAHNELQYQRMMEENNRLKRRQLVYRKDPTAAVMQRSRLSSEPVKQLTLPGFDGQELQFAINRADLEPSWQSGNFTGRLANQPNSMVTLAFKFGREAFTVV